MTPEDIRLRVAAKNGKNFRLVIAYFGTEELFRDNLDTNSGKSRTRFINELAGRLGLEPAKIAVRIEAQLVEQADAADLEAAEESEPKLARLKARKSVMLPGEYATINDTAVKLGDLLADTGGFYLRGGVPMRAVDVEGEVRLEPLRPAAACSDFETVADLVRMRATKGGPIEVPAVCSETTAKQIIESQVFRSALPAITVLSRCPVLIEREVLWRSSTDTTGKAEFGRWVRSLTR